MTQEVAERQLKKLLSVVDYTKFVQDLSMLAKDPKIQNLLQYQLDKGTPIYMRLTDIPVRKLKPMQNEIDITKSLKFPLKNPDAIKNCFSPNAITIVSPLFTYDNDYIVDGHHRWSQVYCINPDAKMVCFDLLAKLVPLDVLKIVQVKIAADTGNVKTEPVTGSNLLKDSDANISKYIADTMIPEAEEVLKDQYKVSSKEDVIKRIIDNIKKMRQTSQPIAGAPKRNVMPQTDAVPDLADDLKKGEVGTGALKNFSAVNSRDTGLDHLYNLNLVRSQA